MARLFKLNRLPNSGQKRCKNKYKNKRIGKRFTHTLNWKSRIFSPSKTFSSRLDWFLFTLERRRMFYSYPTSSGGMKLNILLACDWLIPHHPAIATRVYENKLINTHCHFIVQQAPHSTWQICQNYHNLPLVVLFQTCRINCLKF